MVTIYKKSFEGEWNLIPFSGNTNSQLILSKILKKGETCEKIIYNFNYDVLDDVFGYPNELMDMLLGLNKNIFYKRIINKDNNSITFYEMNEKQINEYKEKNKKNN